MVGRVDFGLLDPDGPSKGDTWVFQPGHAEALAVLASGSQFLRADEMSPFHAVDIRSPGFGGR